MNYYFGALFAVHALISVAAMRTGPPHRAADTMLFALAIANVAALAWLIGVSV